MASRDGTPRPASNQSATVTTRTAWPVPLAESRTLIVTDWLPFIALLVSHGIETGPLAVVFVVPITELPRLIV
jgi:hypothetical protein